MSQILNSLNITQYLLTGCWTSDHEVVQLCIFDSAAEVKHFAVLEKRVEAKYRAHYVLGLLFLKLHEINQRVLVY